MKRSIKLLSQGNPIIDIVAQVSTNFLKKYDLPSNATVLPTPSLMPIFDDLINNFDCTFRPAGSAFNTMRACQVCFFVNLARNKIQLSGINSLYGINWK